MKKESHGKSPKDQTPPPPPVTVTVTVTVYMVPCADCADDAVLLLSGIWVILSLDFLHLKEHSVTVTVTDPEQRLYKRSFNLAIIHFHLQHTR